MSQAQRRGSQRFAGRDETGFVVQSLRVSVATKQSLQSKPESFKPYHGITFYFGLLVAQSHDWIDAHRNKALAMLGSQMSSEPAALQVQYVLLAIYAGMGDLAMQQEYGYLASPAGPKSLRANISWTVLVLLINEQ